MFYYPYEGYRSVTPLDAARVKRTIFNNQSVHGYYITLIKSSRTRDCEYLYIAHTRYNTHACGVWVAFL